MSQVTTVQLNNNTDRNWGTTTLRNDFPNGTLLRTFEQQQEKGKTRINTSIFAQKSVTVLKAYIAEKSSKEAQVSRSVQKSEKRKRAVTK